MERNRRNSREEEESSTNWGLWGGIGVGVAAAAGALYYIATRNRETVLEQQPDERRRLEAIDFSQHQQQVPMIRYESGLQLQGDLPGNQGINNLNSLLNDIYVRYTGVKKDDFRLHYSVFKRIFNRLHQKMKDVDKYYNRYSSTVQITGSHSDKLRIKKPDEFDMDIVIKLPLSIKQNPYNVNDSDFIIEPKDAGFVYLKMGVQYDKLPMRDGGSNWDINKTAYKWSDDYGYLLRSKFTDWFKGVVVKALNQFEKNENGYTVYEVDGVEYSIGRSESGPAVTLHIFNRLRKFKMDVDLVPALKFPEERWPPGPDYRDIPYNCRKGYWMVVPKPNKRSQYEAPQTRSWRIAMYNQESELLNNTNHLRQAIKLVKKFRDAQNMDPIASYYIKTLAFWEIVRIQDNDENENENDPWYWQRSPAEIFKLFVQRFHEAMVKGSIPYFWNENENLIGGIHRQALNMFAAKLRRFITVLDNLNYKEVAKFLLTTEEFAEYEIYL